MDSSGLKKGAADAEKSQDKIEKNATKNSAASKKRDAESAAALKKRSAEEAKFAKESEERAKRAAQALSKVRNEVLALAASYLGFSAIKSAGEAIISTDADLGRLSKRLGMNVTEMSAWIDTAGAFGAKSEDVIGAFENINKIQQEIDTTGNTSALNPLLRAGVDAKFFNNATKAQDKLLLLSEAFKKLSGPQASFLGRQAGFTDKFIQQLQAGPKALLAEYELRKKLAPLTEQATKDDAELQAGWDRAKTAVMGLGRTILHDLMPAIKTILNGLASFTDFAQKHVGLTEIAVGALVAVMLSLSAISFVSLLGGLSSITGALGLAATAAKGFVGLLGGAALVAAAGAAGYALGSAFYDKFVSGTKFSEGLGHLITKTLASLGNEEAKQTLEDEKKFSEQAASAVAPSRGAAVPAKPNLHADHEALRKEAARQLVEVGLTPPASTPAASAKNEPRGIRNNNPGNLNFVGQTGATKEEGPGGRFAVFKSMEDGLIALARQLQLYGKRGLDTVRDIIEKYAPKGENNTEAYIASVAKKLGVGANEHLDLNNKTVLKTLIQGITTVEVGAGKIATSQIDHALNAGAQSAVIAAQSNQTNNQASNTNQVETHINGPININAPNAKTNGDVGGAIGEKLGAYSFGAMANIGLD